MAFCAPCNVRMNNVFITANLSSVTKSPRNNIAYYCASISILKPNLTLNFCLVCEQQINLHKIRKAFDVLFVLFPSIIRVNK